MLLSQIKIKGYRNFKDDTINLNNKTLIIGANDVGKTNLLCALRLLLDRTLSDYDIDPEDSDFYAYEDTNEFEIILHFENVIEDCIVSKLKGFISDKDELFICYKGYRDFKTKSKSYKLFIGYSIDKFEEIEDRFYRRVLNVKYISSRRDFHNYIEREKQYLFQLAKSNRTEKEVLDDDKLYSDIQSNLKLIDDYIPKLNFISSATDTINEELLNLSLHHSKQEIIFDANSSNVNDFINGVSISSRSNNQSVLIGGDGRLNQIYLALWSTRNKLTEDNFEEVSIVCIEEPEAHLHPHQQRKLAEYLNKIIKGQVLITSHSPQIACEFSPNSIIRLFSEKNSTKAASNGCSQIIDSAFKDFGYRLSIIPAEAFFSDIVLLIEGPSEELFYKTMSKILNIDIDRLNISILMVDGVGFETYLKILNSLKIKWILRTDNDIFKIPNKEEYRFAGIQRCIGFYRNFCELNDTMKNILEINEPFLQGFSALPPPQKNIIASKKIIEELEKYNIYLSYNDLENDLFNSEIKQDLIKYFKNIKESEIVNEMQKRKATFMYSFLKDQKSELAKLEKNQLIKPLITCKNIIGEIQNGTK